MQCKPPLKAGITSKLDQILQASSSQDLKIPKDLGSPQLPWETCSAQKGVHFLMKNTWIVMTSFILKYISLSASKISEITIMMSYHHQFK